MVTFTLHMLRYIYIEHEMHIATKHMVTHNCVGDIIPPPGRPMPGGPERPEHGPGMVAAASMVVSLVY